MLDTYINDMIKNLYLRDMNIFSMMFSSKCEPESGVM